MKFVYLWAIIAAVLGLTVLANMQEARITALEEGPSCRADCLPMQHLLSNRVIPKVHSFARPHNVCQP